MTGHDQWAWDAQLDALIAAPDSHRLLLENERVRVLEITIAPGQREPEHTHRWPSVMIVDQPASIRYYENGIQTYRSPGPPAPRQEPKATWMDAEGPHAVENIDSSLYHALRIELKMSTVEPMREPRAFTIRPAGPSDAGSMREVATEAYQRYVNRIGRRPRPMTADYDRIAESGHAWVAEESGRIVGLLVLKPAGDHMLLENVAVAPHAQRLGVGARLLEVAEEQACADDLPEVRLYTNEAMVENLAYYPRRGYHETHRSTQDGFRRVFFSKMLV